jgi:hypothetical protein
LNLVRLSDNSRDTSGMPHRALHKQFSWLTCSEKILQKTLEICVDGLIERTILHVPRHCGSDAFGVFFSSGS